MDILTSVLNFIKEINNLGATVIMPIIIMVIGLIFGVSFGKSLRSGLMVGVGFMGVNLVLGAFWGIADVASAMVERFNLPLDVLDAGWGVASTIAWGYGFIVPIVVAAVIILNIIMIYFKLTKTLMIDIWNFWHFLIVASAVYFITNSVIFGVLAALIVAASMFILADWTAPLVEEGLGLPEISFPHGSTVPWALPGHYLNKLWDLTPLKNIKADPETIRDKFGVFGEPGILGFLIGGLISILAGQTLAGILSTSIITAGIMVIFPRVLSILVEGLMPISEGAREFLQKRMKGREIYLGLDGIIMFGHPAVMAVLLLMIPITLLLAAILPGNKVLPFADLVGLPIVAWAVGSSKFDVVKGLLTSIVLAIPMLYIATDMAPVVTAMAHELNYAIPEGTAQISALVVGGQPINWIVIKLFSLFAI